MKNLIIVFLLGVIAYMVLGRKKALEAANKVADTAGDVVEKVVDHIPAMEPQTPVVPDPKGGIAPVYIQADPLMIDRPDYYYGNPAIPNPAVQDNPILVAAKMSAVPTETNAFASFTPVVRHGAFANFKN